MTSDMPTMSPASRSSGFKSLIEPIIIANGRPASSSTGITTCRSTTARVGRVVRPAIAEFRRQADGAVHALGPLDPIAEEFAGRFDASLSVSSGVAA